MKKIKKFVCGFVTGQRSSKNETSKNTTKKVFVVFPFHRNEYIIHQAL